MSPAPSQDELKALEAALVPLAGSLTALVLLKYQWFVRKYKKFRTYVTKAFKGVRK